MELKTGQRWLRSTPYKGDIVIEFTESNNGIKGIICPR